MLPPGDASEDSAWSRDSPVLLQVRQGDGTGPGCTADMLGNLGQRP